MELKILDLPALRDIYIPCLKRDFPPDELMPLNYMEELTQEGMQFTLGFYRDEELAAYAVFIQNGRGSALLNYYAVQPQLRGQGVGTECLGMLRQAADRMGVRWIVFEVEAPEEAESSQEAETRRRRVDFYLRGGARPTGVHSLLFGVHYRIMLLPAASLGEAPALPEDGQVHRELEALYRAIISERPTPEFRFQDVCRVWTGS